MVDRYYMEEIANKIYSKNEVIAILTDIQLEIEEIAQEEKYHDSKWALGLKYSEKVIQEKINVLRGEEDDA